jgi:formylglycine-generating enzyme required for sulfatase activity
MIVDRIEERQVERGRRPGLTCAFVATLTSAILAVVHVDARIRAADDSAVFRNPNGTPSGASTTQARITPSRPDAGRRGGNEPRLLVAPFEQRDALAARRAWAEYREIPAMRQNSLRMDLVLVPPGEFRMGSEETYEEIVGHFPYVSEFADANPAWKTALLSGRPQHRVRITRPCYFSVFEVTKGQFKTFVADSGYKTDAEQDGQGGFGYDPRREPSHGESPIHRSPRFTWRDWGVNQSDKSPVVNVSWNDATAFCEWLSRREAKTYRLPTEAEWEYACRAGTTSYYYNSNDPEELTKIGNVADVTAGKKFPWWTPVGSSDGWAFTCPVGRFQPNSFGLYDMIGNAAEWCHDWFGESYYQNSPHTDPIGPPSGSFHVIRGGGWSNRDVGCRCARRYDDVATYRNCYLGFRVVCVP